MSFYNTCHFKITLIFRNLLIIFFQYRLLYVSLSGSRLNNTAFFNLKYTVSLWDSFSLIRKLHFCFTPNFPFLSPDSASSTFPLSALQQNETNLTLLRNPEHFPSFCASIYLFIFFIHSL